MLLYLLRHAEAADNYPDAKRPLSPKGRDDTASLGKLLKRQGIPLPSLVWCSPYLRAQETAQILIEEAGSDSEIETHTALTPECSAADLLPALASANEDLLIVGHNPHLSILAGLLIGGPDAIVQYRKCTLARFERISFYSQVTPARWALDWFIPPKLFR
mgnify:CR=1 FL=1|jgi:phosphohistidine phosphatase|tara:strand:- start:96 stop:575 length:480 start_codon:yes stop_codon:yes gene_type:complete